MTAPGPSARMNELDRIYNEAERYFAALKAEANQLEIPREASRPPTLYQLSFEACRKAKRAAHHLACFEDRRPARRRSVSPNNRIPSDGFYGRIGYKEHEERRQRRDSAWYRTQKKK